MESHALWCTGWIVEDIGICILLSAFRIPVSTVYERSAARLPLTDGSSVISRSRQRLRHYGSGLIPNVRAQGEASRKQSQ
jgi:hypothetical protein